ncbi:MAG: hypothetical protein RR313_10235 [Anaerovoracaceae bacterium]
MRIEIKVLIKGNFIINEPVQAKSHPYDFTILKEDNNSYIIISKKVLDYQNYMTKCDIIDGVPHFTLTSEEIYIDIIDWLQYIESMGAFNFEVESVGWDEPAITWIPEIEEERGIMPLLSHQRQHQKKVATKRLSQSNLQNVVIYRRCLKDIYIPFTYYRQGMNLFNQRKYYFTYINFFMMLEYCFANGKVKKSGVLKEFGDAYLLRKSITSAIELVKNTDNKAHFEWLQTECSNRQKKVDVDGVLHILIEFRGLLSHASKLSEKYLFNDNELFSISLITSLICHFVCGNLQIGNCLFGKQKEEYLFGNKSTQ